MTWSGVRFGRWESVGFVARDGMRFFRVTYALK
jgi:hypothetical protein